jgi:hypothetical protein
VRFTYLGVSYTGDVKTNSYYPTFGSMFSVYLGLHDKTSIVNSGTYSAPTIKVTVSEQRLVSKENLFLLSLLLIKKIDNFKKSMQATMTPHFKTI